MNNNGTIKVLKLKATGLLQVASSTSFNWGSRTYSSWVIRQIRIAMLSQKLLSNCTCARSIQTLNDCFNSCFLLDFTDDFLIDCFAWLNKSSWILSFRIKPPYLFIPTTQKGRQTNANKNILVRGYFFFLCHEVHLFSFIPKTFI